MKINRTRASAVAVLMSGISLAASAQSSVTSLADYKKKQDDGIAESVRVSQTRAKAGRLGMMDANGKAGKGAQRLASRPAIIHLANPPRQVGVDNRRRIVVR